MTLSRRAVLPLVAALALGGCGLSASPPSPAFTRQAECARNGGWWHADMHFCEYQR